MVKPIIFSGGIAASGQICPDLFDRVAALDRDLNLGYKIHDQLDVDPGILAQVRRVLRDLGRPGRTRPASQALAKLGRAAVPAVLVSCYLLQNSQARQEAVNFLKGISSDPEVRPRLLAGISSKHDGAREVCQNALGSSMPENYLLGILANRSAPIEERARAGDRLCQARSSAAVPHLAGLLAEAPAGSYERMSLQSLAKNLGLMGEALYEPLYQGMETCSTPALENFYLAFGSTGVAGRRFLLDKFNPAGPREANRRIIRCLGKQARKDGGAVTALVRLLESYPAGDWRYAAVEELGKSKLRDAVPALQGLLSDPDAAVRGRSFTSLAQLNCRDIIPLAEQALSRPGVDLHAAEALGLLGDDRGPAHLLQVAATGAGDQRRQALQALGRLGIKSVSHLITHLGGGDLTVNLTAIEGLGRIRGGRAKELAAAALVDSLGRLNPRETVVACHALRNLGLPGARVTTALSRLARQGETPQERKAAQQALDALRTRRPEGGGIGEE